MGGRGGAKGLKINPFTYVLGECFYFKTLKELEFKYSAVALSTGYRTQLQMALLLLDLPRPFEVRLK